MEPLSTWLKVAALVLLALLHLRTEAMEVTSTGPQTIQKAHWETVKLGCTYTADPGDTGELDIEWSNISPDMTQKDKLILSYSGGKTHHYGDPGVSKRLMFTGDPTQGDASIAIADVRASDTATYQCKVKKVPGVDTRKVTLVVMVPPSMPKCWVEGGEEKGETLSLRCKSSQGSTPISYVWTREGGLPLPPTAIYDPETGELLMKNHTDGNAGGYMCEAKNAVGRAECKYALHAYNPTNKVGVIVGAVIGALLLLLLLLFLIWLLICCCNKRRYEKETANDIKEDVDAPDSRPASRNPSMRSVMGYKTHNVYYSSVRKSLPSRSGSARSAIHSGSIPPPVDVGETPPPVHYVNHYGSPV